MAIDDDLFGEIPWSDNPHKSTGENPETFSIEQYLDWLIAIGSLQNPSRDIVLFKERFRLD